MTTPHPPLDDLTAFGRGRLSATAAAVVEDHLGECDSCRDALTVVPDDDLVKLVHRSAPGPVAATAAGRAEYRNLTFHARGGLGEVARAWADDLGREVAIKRLLPSAEADPACRRRFEREAGIAARLEHPGIVPVYGRAADADGRPAYVMRFVRGRTLREAVRDYHAGPPDAIAFRGLLTRFTVVCSAVAYAHSRGVVHRDIKPANVLLGEFGETLLLDWGLAKELASGPRERAVGETNIAFAFQASDDDPTGLWGEKESDGHTAAGTVLGTPGYMAPEQAAGQAVGPPADVYALGATLYTLLTDATPGKPGKPAPAALLAVARKAMADRPADRYETPLALTADVDRFLAGEPVSAYRDPPVERLRRWARRNRSLVRVGAATLVVAAVGSTVAAVLLNQANGRERAAAALADRRKTEAEASYRRARRAVDELYVAVSEGRLKSVPGAQPFRKDLLRAALTYYQEFVVERADDPANRADLAATYSKVAMIVGEVETAGEAVVWHEKAVAAWQELAADHPDRPEYRKELAGALDLYGLQLARMNRLADALKGQEEAVGLLDALLAADPENWEYASYLSRVLVNLSVAQGKLGRSEAAIRTGERGLALGEDMIRRQPDKLVLRRHMVSRWINLGLDLGDLGRTDDSIRALERAVQLAEELVAELDAHPDRAAVAGDAISNPRGGLAGAELNLGLTLLADEQYADARRLLLGAAEKSRMLAVENPTVRLYRELALAAEANAVSAGLQGGVPATTLLAEADRACATGVKLVADDGSNPDYRSRLGLAHAVRGAVLARLGKAREAGEAWAAADDCFPADPGGNSALKQLQTGTVYFRALGRLALGDAPGAAQDAQAYLASTPPQFPAARAAAARVYAGCAKLSTGADRRRYEELALAALRAAVRGGYRHAGTLATDPAFEPLRGREEWPAVLAEKATGR